MILLSLRYVNVTRLELRTVLHLRGLRLGYFRKGPRTAVLVNMLERLLRGLL